MIATALTHLARRGAEVVVGDGDKNVLLQLPTWGIFLVVATCLIFLPVLFFIQYTFGRLLPTLLMIESPAEDLSFEPLATEDPDASLDPSTNKTTVPVTPRPQYITSSFRSFHRHLISVGGRRGRFRGLSVFVFNVMAVGLVASLISVFPIIRMFPRAVPNMIAAVMCANLDLAWTCIVISEPSPKPWFRRLPTMKVWKKVAAPTAVLAVAEQLSIFIPYYIAVATNLVDHTADNMDKYTSGQKTGLAFQGLGLALFGMVLSLLLVVPARVVLTRVQASLLSDTEETIVPFDRSFGGKVVPEIVGGTGVIGMLDAWKTFDFQSRIRLVKVYVKVFILQFAVSLVFVIILALQLVLLVGNAKEIPVDGDKM